MSGKPWAGRFTQATDRRVELFTASIDVDVRLYEQDIRGSIAHVRMLREVGFLTTPECDLIEQSLSEIQADIASGQFSFATEREDIHMHIESALIEKLGDLGRKLHTARSRNDQVATDLKLWVREAAAAVDERLWALQVTWVEFARRHEGTILPGFTHLQRAQPVLAAHYALAYVEKLERDRGRLADCGRRLNALPLGAAALAGTTLPIDRDVVARQLGFDSVAANSMDVSSDRDFVLEFVFVLAMIALHLSGWAEEWVLWSTCEFGFLDLDQAVCTGSSIMPQKKNPDVCELIRGKAARVTGDLVSLMVLVKGLPLAYNRDLQEDKRPLFDAFDTVRSCLELADLVVAGARLRSEAIEASLEEGFLDATTLMEHLIGRGIPQRTAHEMVGRLVAVCEGRGCGLSDLGPDDLSSLGPETARELSGVLGVRNALAAFRSYGSTAPDQVERQLSLWSDRLEARRPRTEPRKAEPSGGGSPPVNP